MEKMVANGGLLLRPILQDNFQETISINKSFKND